MKNKINGITKVIITKNTIRTTLSLLDGSQITVDMPVAHSTEMLSKSLGGFLTILKDDVSEMLK